MKNFILFLLMVGTALAQGGGAGQGVVIGSGGGGGGGGTPGGSSGDWQYNNAGAFGGYTPATGWVTLFGTPTSANVRGWVTDESGTGALLFAGGAGGAFTVTTLNGNTFTTGTYTLTGAAGKTFTFNKSITFTAADDTGSYTLPTGNKTLLATDGSGASLTTLTAANISTGALANGMTATTQSAADNSTKLATTAYADRVGQLVEKIAVFSVDGGGSAITTGTVSGTARIPFACTLTGWSITATGATGTTTVKIWNAATGTAIPTIANVINTSGVSLTTGTAVASATLTDFTDTTYAALDMMRCAVTAVDGTATDLTVTLYGTRQ